jgi:curved DNA-binding protein CbpA
MASQRNHYEILGVTRQATTEEIKKKYRELARKFHPDKVQDKDLGQKVFAQINKAYAVLSDPSQRATYDTSLTADSAAQRHAGTPAASAPRGANAQPLSAQQFANVARLIVEAEEAMMQNKIANVPQMCEIILNTDPRNIKALGILGDALAQMGQPQKAAAAYRQALQIAPSSLIQAKLRRLEGPGGTQPGSDMPPPDASPRTPPPNGAPPTNGANNGSQHRTDQGRNDKPPSGFLGRLLGKK